MLLIPCAFKGYVEYLYCHIFLEDVSTNIKVTKKKMHMESSTVITHACMDNKPPKLVSGFPIVFEACSKYDAYNFSTPQHLVNLMGCISQLRALGSNTPIFVIDWSFAHAVFFCVTLMLVHPILRKENVPVETFNTSLESTQNKKQFGTKITAQR